MSSLQLFALTPAGPQPLPVATGAADLIDLVHGLALGVYSAFRTFEHHKFLYLEDHLARTVRSMQMLGWHYRLDEANLRQALDTVCRAAPWPEARVRIDVLAEPVHTLGADSRVLIGLMPFTPLPETVYETGVTVGIAEGMTRTQPLVKTATFAEVRKTYAVGTPDMFERLMINAEHEILEGFSANFYAVRNDMVYTAGKDVLEGITRKIILDLVKELGLPLRLEAVCVDKLPELQEAAISSSSRGLLPVVKIGDQWIGNGRPGPIFTRLRKAYATFVASAVKPAI